MAARGLAALVALALLAGCGSAAGVAGGGRVIGDAVTVYSSLPDPGRGTSRDMVDGQKLALAQAGGRVGELGINFVSVDEGTVGADDPPRTAAATAERVIRDPQVIAVIGALRSRTAMTAIPLYNAAGLLLVSPGAGYPGFTDPIAPGEPARWYPSGYRSFGRLVRDDGEQARALLAAARRSGTRVAVEQEPGPVGAAQAAALRAADAADARVRLVDDGARADAVVYAGEDVDAAARAAGRARRAAGAAGEAPLVLPDALTRAGVADMLDPAVRRRAVLVSSAPEPGSTAELRAFEAAFREAYGREPGPYAAVGFEGMRRVLAAIERAGAAARQRRRVIDAFFVAPPEPPPFTAFRLRGGAREYLAPSE